MAGLREAPDKARVFRSPDQPVLRGGTGIACRQGARAPIGSPALALGLALVLAGLVLSAPVFAGSRAFVEINDAGDQLNPAVVRRLVALELSDINVPGNPRIQGDREQDVSLHCRVMSEEGALRVELWERGESAGARRVSLQGTPALVARRVALAAAELARRLVHLRHAEARRLHREEKQARRLAAERAEQARRRRLALTTGVRGTGFAEGAYWAGPRVGAQLNRDHPFRVEVGMSWLAGQLTTLEEAPLWRAFELDIAPGWVFPLTPKMDLALSAPVSAAIVQTHGDVLVDHLPNQRETWLARGGLGARLQPRLGPRLRLDVGLAGGWLLRSVPLQRTPGVPGEPGESARLAGPWAELFLGVLLD